MVTPIENLGPAERIIQSVIAHADHMYHGRSGAVVPAPGTPIGVLWSPVTHRVENGEKIVYRMDKAGKKTLRVRLGTLQADNRITDNGRTVATYRPAGLFPEVVCYLYRQVADVYRLDNEFAARWASYAFAQEHRDLKTVLAAFMLVQDRKGDPVMIDGKKAFLDDDFRSVGEAMLLLTSKDNRDFNPKMVARVHQILALPEIAAVNRELGFGKSARRPFLGRLEKTTHRWLHYREENARMLDGLVKAGLRRTVIDLSKRVGFKPSDPKFFQTLRWKQSQSKDGRRTISIGAALTKAESWEGMTERQICQAIVQNKPSFKRITGLLPKGRTLTPAIVAAAIESGAMSDKDLIIYTPTLEDLGLLRDPDISARWNRAVKNADDMRAANIATRVRSTETKEKLQEASDQALQRQVAEVSKDIRVYVMVDTSASMEGAIEKAKVYIARFLQGFAADRVHVSTFTTSGRVVEIRHPSAAGVETAFKGIRAAGGTDYGAGVLALAQFKPLPTEDVLFVFVGDEEAHTFAAAVRQSGLSPMAFGFVKTTATSGTAGWRATTYGTDNNVAVRNTAAELGIPCFMIDEATFADPYAIPRTIRNLVASTPVSAATRAQAKPRETLIDQIVRTKLLARPTWA